MKKGKSRPHVLYIALSEEEMTKLRKMSNFEGMSMSGYFRHLLRHGKLPLAIPPMNLSEDPPGGST